MTWNHSPKGGSRVRISRTGEMLAKFNKRSKTKKYSDRKDATTNEEGGLAFKMSPEMELYIRSASCFFGEKKFYDTEGEGDNEIVNLVGTVSQTNPEFPLQLASYCRNELYLRSIPIVLLVESCKHQSKKFVRRYTTSIIRRADELAEAMAYYKFRNGDIGDVEKKGMMCNPLKRGLADAFHSFNEYQYAKYDRDGDVKIKDVMKVVHPKPRNPKESQLFKKILNRNLTVPDTWEVVISTKGSTKENWSAVAEKMPIMAKIRNLRNFLDKKVDINPIVKDLENPDIIKKSKQYPFRFLSAYNSIENSTNPDASRLMEALETAINISAENIPTLNGKTFVGIDLSGSMNARTSGRSQMSLKEIASVFGATIHRNAEKTVVCAYGTTTKILNLSKKDSVLRNAQRISSTDVGGSTEAYKAIEHLIQEKNKVDRIILLTDEESYDSTSWGETERSVKGEVDIYRRTVNPDVYVYTINLAGYGTTELPEGDKNTCLIGGWSEKVLEFIPAFENKEQILERIKKIKPRPANDETPNEDI